MTHVLRAMMEDLFQGFPNKFDCAALVRLSLNTCVDSAVEDVQEHLYFMGCSQCTIAMYTVEMLIVRGLV